MQERAANDARADAAGHFLPQVLLSLSFTKQAIRIIAQYCIVVLFNCVQIPESTQSICQLVIKSPIILGTDC